MPTHDARPHCSATPSNADSRRARGFLLQPRDWTWWAWASTAVLLAFAVAGHAEALVAAVGLTVVQTIVLLGRERLRLGFAVELRLAYLLLLGVCALPGMQGLLWLPMLGTFALVVSGYCLLARCLSLLPWHRRERWSVDLLRRTFLCAPDPARAPRGRDHGGCAGGLCTIEAQVAPRSR